jgi:hypothetical protein
MTAPLPRMQSEFVSLSARGIALSESPPAVIWTIGDNTARTAIHRAGSFGVRI